MPPPHQFVSRRVAYLCGALLLSGSGSAVVGLFAERATADAALAGISARHAAGELLTGLVTETVPASAYARAIAPVEATAEIV